jgi:hypothetical protein
MPTWKLTLEPDRYGREQTRTINLIIDIRDFRDKPGFAWLLIAANPALSVRDTQEVLASVADAHYRPVGWISRHRWMLHETGKPGGKRNADGLDAKALKIMAENPRLSANQLVRLLKDNGISRGREWVRKHRVAVP